MRLDPAAAGLSPGPAAARRGGKTLLDLPRLVMRRAAVVGALVLTGSLLLGLYRMGEDIEGEADAAMVLATLMAQLAELPQTPDDQALALLRGVQRQGPLRHVVLQVQDADGRSLLLPDPGHGPTGMMRMLVALHRTLFENMAERRVSWQVARPQGGPWLVSLSASHDSERQEAMATLVDALGFVLLAVLGLLLVMRWNMRRAFAPLGRLVSAIERVEGQDTVAVRSLPPMPVRELEVVAGALRQLGAALDRAEAERRTLSQRVHSLQEDERAHLARELHDEFGQQLTALRVDAAWLGRQVGEHAALRPVAEAMAARCGLIQQDIRALLTRLQPFGPASGDGTGEPLPRLLAMLHALVRSWAGTAESQAAQVRLDQRWLDPNGVEQPWPDEAVTGALCLPRPLVLTLYRITQEALTNAARHAQARVVRVSLDWHGVPEPAAAMAVDWSVSDDGVGLDPAAGAAWRGNGLAGVRERVWAQGGDLRLTAARPDGRPGLVLSARFASRWMA